MSTKKKDTTPVQMTQRDGVTMILEKKTKKASPDIQAKLEAGKAEIMKVVEGVQGAEKLSELIERGKKKGNLSSSELLDVLEDMDLESDQMDKIYDTLENLGIDTVGEDYIPDLPDDADPPLEAMEDITTAKVGDKTMMDALIPASEAVAAYTGDSADELFDAAAQAAAQGAEATKQYVSKFGRAKSYGTKTIGTPDAGAVSLVLPGAGPGITCCSTRRSGIGNAPLKYHWRNAV